MRRSSRCAFGTSSRFWFEARPEANALACLIACVVSARRCTGAHRTERHRNGCPPRGASITAIRSSLGCMCDLHGHPRRRSVQEISARLAGSGCRSQLLHGAKVGAVPPGQWADARRHATDRENAQVPGLSRGKGPCSFGRCHRPRCQHKEPQAHGQCRDREGWTRAAPTPASRPAKPRSTSVARRGSQPQRSPRFSGAEGNFVFVRMFNTLQLNMHFISVIARTRSTTRTSAGSRSNCCAAGSTPPPPARERGHRRRQALFSHGITSLASATRCRWTWTCACCRRSAADSPEVLVKIDQLMPLLQTLEIHEVVSAQAVDTQRAGSKRQVRDIANGAQFATGLRRRHERARCVPFRPTMPGNRRS